MINWIGTLRWIYARVNQIFALVNAILTTTETGGTVNTAALGTEYTIYENDSPGGVFEPMKVMIDFSAQDVAETVVVRLYYRIRPSPAAKILKDQIVFEGVQGLPLKNIELEPNRYGLRVSIQRNAGIAQDYPWAVYYRV